MKSVAFLFLSGVDHFADAHFALVGPKPWWPASMGDQWYMNWTFSTEPPKLKLKPGEPTTSSPRGVGQFPYDPTVTNYKQWAAAGTVDDWAFKGRTPWISPGTAPVDSPCGVKGGNKKGCWAPCVKEHPNSSWHNWYTPCVSGVPRGPIPGSSTTRTECPYAEELDSLDLKAHQDYFMPSPITYWRAGQTAETSHKVNANHGGGYSFRLCEVNSFDPTDLIKVTEECFQETTLKFFGETQWLECPGDAARTPVKAVLVTGTDVHPVNSQWRRGPIPPCKNPYEEWGQTCSEPAFDPPKPDLYGFVFGFGRHTKRHVNECLIIDKVQVPQKPGKYVFSFRHDNEFHTQIWQGCSNLQILAPDEPDPTPTLCLCPAGKILRGSVEVKFFKKGLKTCQWLDDFYAQKRDQKKCDEAQRRSGWSTCCVDPPVEPEAESENEGEGSNPEAEPENEGEGSEAKPESETSLMSVNRHDNTMHDQNTKLSRQVKMTVDEAGSVDQM